MNPCKAHPCPDCPFRRTAVRGWLGGYKSATHFMVVHVGHEVVNPCHMSINYDDPAWLEKFKAGEAGHACRGQADMFRNQLKLARPGTLRVEEVHDPNPDVFDSVVEFIQHHDPNADPLEVSVDYNTAVFAPEFSR